MCCGQDSLRPTLRSVLEGIVAFHGCFVPRDVPLVKPSGKSPPKTETFPAILYCKSVSCIFLGVGLVNNKNSMSQYIMSNYYDN